MDWLITEGWLPLLAALTSGFVAGWLWQGRRLEHRLRARERRWERQVKKAEAAADVARAELAAVKARLAEAAEAKPQLAADAPDDLRQIRGIGPRIEQLLHELGVRTYRQIALWQDHDLEQVATRLGNFRDRIRRDDWRAGAKIRHFEKYGEQL